MNYYLKTLLIFLVSSLIAGTSLAGGGISFAKKYEITMLKMELCTDAPLVSETDVTCTGSVVLGTGNTVFDIASVLKNEAIGTFVSSTGLPIGTTENNLKAAVAGETHEYTDMYPGMAKTARDEGFDEVADWFETLAKAERSHANRYVKALGELVEM